ncbi:hypothetical protein SLS64_005842 [Diaporthe eres]
MQALSEAKANVRCEFREDDFKRPPVSREYIAALESRVATLEAVIGRLKRASYEERDEILEGVTIQEHTQPFAPETAADPDVDEIALSDAIRKATLHETDEGISQQVELGRIIHDILGTTFVPKRNEKSKARRWTNVLLNKLNARLVAWHEALPNDMRWKKWLTAKDNLLPDICMLHTLYHNTRICLNLPFLVSSIERDPSAPDTNQGQGAPSEPNAARMRYLTELANICKQSSESLVDILHRFRAQHTLVNSPIILVYGAIVATNAVLVTLRHQHRNANEPPMRIKDTALPALDTYLQELSVPWALAGEARIKFQRALSTWYRQTPAPTGQPAFSEQWPTSSSQATTGPAAGTDMRYMDLYPVDPALQASLDQSQYQEQPHGWYQEIRPEYMQPQPQQGDAATGTGSSPDVNFESPVPLVWDPMNVFDGEVALWATIGGGFPAGIDAGFDTSGMAWTEE